MRALIISHGHPKYSKGGAEIAAHRLHRGLKACGDCQSLFLAAVPNAFHFGRSVAVESDDEMLFEHRPDFNWFYASSRTGKLAATRDFQEILEAFQPDVVHFHHYINFGLEFLRAVKRWRAEVPLVLTLHEYIAICPQNGQMVTKQEHALCEESSPRACHACFPDTPPADFKLRQLFLQAAFALVDQFIAPSEFLKQRYVRWGLPEEKILVLENGQEPLAALPPRPCAPGEPRGRFAFFGQQNPFKGIQVLLKAVECLPAALRRKLHVAIYSKASWPDEEFHKDLYQRAKALGSCVSFQGPYESPQMPHLMAGTDWVVVPSIWWENSPMVIQEAFTLGRPVIASDIGGMAEKVRHGVDGLQFRVSSPQGLADVITDILAGKTSWDTLCANIRKPITIHECARAHQEKYAQLMARNGTQATLNLYAPQTDAPSPVRLRQAG